MQHRFELGFTDKEVSMMEPEQLTFMESCGGLRMGWEHNDRPRFAVVWPHERLQKLTGWQRQTLGLLHDIVHEKASKDMKKAERMSKDQDGCPVIIVTITLPDGKKVEWAEWR